MIERFLRSDRMNILSLYRQEPLRKRILIAVNINIVIRHLLRFEKEQNTERMEPVFDEELPIGSTRDAHLVQHQALSSDTQVAGEPYGGRRLVGTALGSE